MLQPARLMSFPRTFVAIAILEAHETIAGGRRAPRFGRCLTGNTQFAAVGLIKIRGWS